MMSHKPVRTTVRNDFTRTEDLKEVFSTLAHELRIEILMELWNADTASLGFAELCDRVDVRDTGKFNYHLDTLTPSFVRRTGEEYALTFAGEQLIGAAVSGVYTDADGTDIESVDAGTCFACDGTSQLDYRNGRAIIKCQDCGSLLGQSPVPPIVVRQADAGKLPQIVSDLMLAQFQTISRGFCLYCGGCLDSTLTVDTEHDPITHHPMLDVTSECRACGNVSHQNIGVMLLDNPTVGAFLFETGFDLLSTYLWEAAPVLNPEVTLLEEDPIRLELIFELSDEALEVVVDSDGTVLEVEAPAP